MKFSKRRVVTAGPIALLSVSVSVHELFAAGVPVGAVTPEMYGAKGDGTTNDSAAFSQAAREIERRGGGVLWMRPVIYCVGTQRAVHSGYAFEPAPLIQIRGCKGSVKIRGNGATLRCTAGLRYGLFRPRDGAALGNTTPFYEAGFSAVPYTAMIAVEACSGTVEVTDIELDGSLPMLRIGGPWGDTGWQLPCVGLRLSDNHGNELVRNVHSHRHAQDGLILNGLATSSLGLSRRIERVRLEGNGRQGCSLVGGNGYVFTDCVFATTGTGQIMSAPGAGLDIEAEGRPIRMIRFVGCSFAGTVGPAMVADSGDTADVEFIRCSFVAGRSWAAWPNKPFFRFIDCKFIGPVTRCYGDKVLVRAASFIRCSFTDMVQHDGRGRRSPSGPMVDLSDASNVLFDRCTFTVQAGAALPWSTGAIYRSCTMRQPVNGRLGYPRGVFQGTSIIAGNVDITGSLIQGILTINGVKAH